MKLTEHLGPVRLLGLGIMLLTAGVGGAQACGTYVNSISGASVMDRF